MAFQSLVSNPDPEHKAPGGLPDKWLPKGGVERAGRKLPGPEMASPPSSLAQCLPAPLLLAARGCAVQVEQLLGSCAALGHSIRSSWQQALPWPWAGLPGGLMAFTELMQVRFSAHLPGGALWGAELGPAPSCPVPQPAAIGCDLQLWPGPAEWRASGGCLGPSSSRRPTVMSSASRRPRGTPGGQAGAAGEQLPLRAGHALVCGLQ